MRILFMSIGLVVVLGVLGYFFFTGKNGSPVMQKEGMGEESGNMPESLKYVDFSKVNAPFRFSGKIPAEFEVEYIPQLKALSVYDPSLPKDSMREKSQIYISSFEANRFLTLNTVEITQQDETLINSHDAVLYEITKKDGVSDFTQQPSWRNFKHKAIDIRFAKNNPSVFYSFAYNPALSEDIFNAFINSLVFH